MTSLAGTPALIRLAVRRDRIAIPAWILALTAFTAGSTALWAADLTDPADLLGEVRVTATSAGIRMLGLASGPSVGGYAMVRDYLTLAVLAALMSILAVVRHTRQGEETGRAELVGAAVVGRHASLAAALAVTVGTNVLLAVALGLGLVAAGQPVAGSFTAGAAVAAVGLAFAGVAAVTTQLATSTRGASGLAAAVLGLAFLFSGVGNLAGHADPAGVRVESAWPAWLSPIGWGEQMRPFGGDHWWPLLLAVGVLVGGAAVGAVLIDRRDFGLGLLPQRRGRAGAGRSLRSPSGLAWRLQRNALLGWGVAMVGFGLVLGGLAGQVEDASGAARDWYTRMGGSEQILDAYRSSIMQMAAMAVAVYAVQVLLRMRAEEADGPLEPVLATAVGRIRWAGGYGANALLGALLLLCVFAGSAGLAAGGALGDPAGQVRPLLVAGLAQVPAVVVLAAVVPAGVGLWPRLCGVVSWVALLLAILLGPVFGPSLGLPQWMQDASPFTHVPKAPAAPVTVTPVLALLAVGVGLGVAGALALRRRDLALPA